MSAPCAMCGIGTYDERQALCSHHTVGDEGWSISNRVMCDFFHRKKLLPRLTEVERADDFWAGTE